MNEPFSAVTAQEMRDILGQQCSPDPRRAGYVIGPANNGRLCHIASCFYYNEAVHKARKCNENYARDQKSIHPKVSNIR
jgi:hypothetical protein